MAESGCAWTYEAAAFETRLLGVPVTGGQHAHLARRIRQAGIDTSKAAFLMHCRATRPFSCASAYGVELRMSRTETSQPAEDG